MATPLEQLIDSSWVDAPTDPFEVAAARTKRSVKPPDGRREGLATILPEAILRGLYNTATLSKRFVESAYPENQPLWDSDPEPGSLGPELAFALLFSGLRPGFARPAALGVNAGGPRSRAPLPMDQASRMARARDMGFATQSRLAHGASQEFGAFDPLKLGATTGAGPARLGVWTEVLEPGVPAGLAAEFSKRSQLRTGGYPQTYPLIHRASKPGEFVLPPEGMSVRQMEQTLQQAWADGFDAVTLKNYSMPNGRPHDLIAGQ